MGLDLRKLRDTHKSVTPALIRHIAYRYDIIAIYEIAINLEAYMANLPVRKPNRLDGYDYHAGGMFFVTICVKAHASLLGSIDSNIDGRQHSVTLSKAGSIADAIIREMPAMLAGVTLIHHVVMPNHIHLLLILDESLSLPRVVQSVKSQITRALGKSIFQRSFYDRVVRGDRDYQRIYTYIENNPMKWKLDKYHPDLLQ
jgi:REP element-mobilizing transposase RayT